MGKTLIKGLNDLASLNPRLSTQAFGWDQTTVTAHSGKVLKWICSSSHIWTSSVNNRSRGSGCPYCSGYFPIKGITDLSTKNPNLAREAYGWYPDEFSSMSNQKMEWICRHKHVWSA